MRTLKAILMAPVRVIVFFIQIVLTLGVVIFGAVPAVITKLGEEGIFFVKGALSRI